MKAIFYLIDRGIGASQTVLYFGKSGKEYPFHFERKYGTHVYGPFGAEMFNDIAEDIIGAAWQNRFFPVSVKLVEEK